MNAMNQIPTLENILQAHERIKPYINHTPILYSDYINETLGCEVYFKCENLQKIGAFKARGGFNAVLKLNTSELKNGVTTHSSGNHAQAIALAARTVGTKAYIVMPKNAPESKQNGVRELGGEIIACEPTIAARESTVATVIERTGATFIHPFNDYSVIAGQATAALEMIQEQPKLEILMAPIGGGGLISGTALSSHYLLKNAKVIACEPAGAADAILSFQTGKIEKLPHVNTIADGLLSHLGDKNFGIIQQYVQAIYTVSDEEILSAMQLAWQRLKLIIEPSSAVALAVLIKEKQLFQGKKIGVILTGGNVDLDKIPFLG